MKVAAIINSIEDFAHPWLQEDYDNSGLITGDPTWECKGVVVCLDATEEVILEAMAGGFNMVVAHHPIIFGAIKKINESNYVGRSIITAIKNDIAVYAIHTNLDNILTGVNGRIASMLDLQNTSSLQPKRGILKKLHTFVPAEHGEKVRSAIFAAGAGEIGNYSECSFNVDGIGTFKAGNGANPFVGKIDQRHQENETRMEMIFPAFLERVVVKAMLDAHPYEEVAYDIVEVSNTNPAFGSGIIGDLPSPKDEAAFLARLKEVFKIPVIKHTRFTGKRIKRVAICGGAGSFLVPNALSAGADIFITGDMKYHEFFDANNQILIADIGHYESEQFTINLLQEILLQKFPTFAILKTKVNTNPVNYFF